METGLNAFHWLLAQHIDYSGVRLTLMSMLLSAAVMVGGFFGAGRLAARVRGKGIPPHRGQGWRTTSAKVTLYLLRAITVAVGLQMAGINIGSLVAAGAVLAVGIGIAMQKIAENFVSGVILMAERSIREGDIIEFDGRVVKVHHVGIRATTALSLDDEEFIVPNSILAQSAVKNMTLTEPVYRLRVKLGVAYETDLDVAVAAMLEAAGALAWRDPKRAPVVYLVDFGSSSVDFEISVWTRDVWGMRRGQSDLRLALWRALAAHNISIPFPQLVLHCPGAAGAVSAGMEAGRKAPAS